MIKYTSILDDDYTKQYNTFCDEKVNNYKCNNSEIFKLNLMQLMKEIKNSEKNHQKELKKLALEITLDQYPILKELSPTITMSFSDSINLFGVPNKPKTLKKTDKDFVKKVHKQKILNGLIQGAAYTVNNIHYIIDDLKYYKTDKNYTNLFKLNDFIFYNTDSKLLEKVSLMQSDANMVGGKSAIKISDNSTYFYIESTNFITLIHETVKSLYGYLSLNAHTNEKSYKEVIPYVDSITDEIEDIKHGHFIYIKMKEYIIEHYIKYFDKHPCFFETFFIELCKLEGEKFISTINQFFTNEKHHNIENICYGALDILKKYESEKHLDY